MFQESEERPAPYPPQPGQGYPPASTPERWVEVEFPGEKPVVTFALIGINVFVFLLQLAGPYFTSVLSQTTAAIVSQTGLDPVAIWGMKVNELIMAGEFWRLITPMFLHGSILHLGFNMYALYALGPSLERHYGHARFIALYLISGFAGNVVSFLFSDAPSLGSSTAIFGLLGAEGVFLYRNKKLFGDTAKRALTNVITIAVINLIIGLSPGIDNWGHMGGLVGGTLFAWFAGPVLKVQGSYPFLKLEDEHQSGDAVRAGLTVVVLFAALAGVKVFLS